MNKINFGIATWVKFPLRLLAIDQFDRLIRIIIWAEWVRKKKCDGISPDSDPFSLGFFVGNSPEYPGTVAEWVYDRMHQDVNDSRWSPNKFSRSDGHSESSGALLKECPICRPGDYSWQYIPNEHRVKHWCDECGTQFYIYITDEEVYRYLPSILVSTVDKIAVGAWRPSVSALLGGSLFKCQDHGFSFTERECSIMNVRCGNGYSKHFEVKNRRGSGRPFTNGPFQRFSCKGDKFTEILSRRHAPVLIVQDELHLISENLGTTDSFFETLVDRVIFNNSGRFPKHIAMSATLAGARKQIGLLYMKHGNLWPGDAPSNKPLDIPKHDAFYCHSNDVHRMYVGLYPHGKSPDFSSYRALQYSWSRCQQYRKDISILREILNYSDIHSDRELIKFIDEYYKKSFVYQGRKIGTHNFANALDRIVNPDIKINNPDFKIPTADSVTGDNSLEEIRSFRERMQKEGNLDVLVSTSLISHGVDMDNVNYMFFQGIPEYTSEFIQASSRVGRKYPGLIFISFYPTRSRDIELSSSFKMYIDTMRYWVEDVSISRWCKQALKEIFVTAFCFTITSHGQEIIGSANQIDRHWPFMIYLLGSPNKQKSPGYLAWRIWKQDLDEKIIKFLKNGLGLTGELTNYAPDDLLPSNHVMQELEDLFDDLYSEFTHTLNSIATSGRIENKWFSKQLAAFCQSILGSPIINGGYNSDYVARWYHCMSGLRGIQAPVEIIPKFGSVKYLGE